MIRFIMRNYADEKAYEFEKCLRACAWNGIEQEIVLPFSNLTLTFYLVISYPNEILSNIYFGLRRNEHKLRKNKFH